MPRPLKYSDEQIITALQECKGMVYLAAAKIGCDADTIYHRAKSRPRVKAVMRSERGKVVDTAELKLYQGIMNGEPWAIQMALKCLGKDRGYVERLQVQEVPEDEINSEIESELARLAGRGPAADAGAHPGANGTP